MPKAAKKKKKTAAASPNSKQVLIELHIDDYQLLNELVERYQEPLGKPRNRINTSSKAFVLRQLVRHMARQEELPPLIND